MVQDGASSPMMETIIPSLSKIDWGLLINAVINFLLIFFLRLLKSSPLFKKQMMTEKQNG